jgi:hypothetical protein
VAIKGTNKLSIVNRPKLSRARFHAPSMERSLRRKIRRLSGLLIALSLIPGFTMVVSPDRWRLLAPGVQWSAHLFSIVLLFTAWLLLQKRRSSREEPKDAFDSRDHEVADVRQSRSSSAYRRDQSAARIDRRDAS